MQFAKILSLGLVGFLLGIAIQEWSGWPASVHAAPSAVALASNAKRMSELASQQLPAVLVPANIARAGTPLAAIVSPQVPLMWLPARGRECIRSGKYKGVCQGPRRVPRPNGPEAEMAAELGLGEARTVGRLTLRAPPPQWLAAAGDASAERPLWPVESGRLHRGLLPAREGRRQHKGLDIAAPEGSPIRAIKSGLVAYADNAVPGYGNLLVAMHSDGSVAFYGHCRAIYVFAGQRIKRGQIVGEVGHTGRATGPHVHFEYRVAGRIRNSLPLFGDQVPRRGRVRGARPATSTGQVSAEQPTLHARRSARS